MKKVLFVVGGDVSKFSRLRAINSAFEKQTGYSKKEALGQYTNILKSGNHSEQYFLIIRKKLNNI